MKITVHGLYSKLLLLFAFVLLVGIAVPIWVGFFQVTQDIEQGFDRDLQLKEQLRDQHINISTTH